jgi:hypothetical protein
MPPIPTSELRLARPLKAFRDPIVAPETPVRESPSVSFGDLVRMLAEGIADAQASLDRSSAELVAELAETNVSIVPSVTETIDAAGNVTFAQGAPRQVSLLSLGVTPTFYQFSQSTVEVVLDVKIVESEQVKEDGKRSYGLFAGTADVRVERKLNRDVSAHSKLTATLVPVPMPLRLEPVRTTTTPEP